MHKNINNAITLIFSNENDFNHTIKYVVHLCSNGLDDAYDANGELADYIHRDEKFKCVVNYLYNKYISTASSQIDQIIKMSAFQPTLFTCEMEKFKTTSTSDFIYGINALLIFIDLINKSYDFYYNNSKDVYKLESFGNY